MTAVSDITNIINSISKLNLSEYGCDQPGSGYVELKHIKRIWSARLGDCSGLSITFTDRTHVHFPPKYVVNYIEYDRKDNTLMIGFNIPD
jgi:hypothetical protein